MKLRSGQFCGFDEDSYKWLKSRGVSHSLMREIVTNPMFVYEFRKARVAMGKSFATVPKEHHEEVLNAILQFAQEEKGKKKK